MKTFVTGAGGFIGSHLCEALVKAGHEVKALGHYRGEGSQGWLKDVDLKVNMIPGDVRDTELMMSLVAGADVVFHLAALPDVPYSLCAPRSYIDTNVTGTLNVALAALGTDAKLIHTSTSEIYGNRPPPQHEGLASDPRSTYAASKEGADAVVMGLHQGCGLKATILRPFNTYGPRQSTRGVLAHIIDRAVQGKHIPLGNVNAERDWMFVDDTVSAFMAAMEIDDIGPFNAGTERATSVFEAARMITRITGYREIVSDPARERPDASEVHKLRASAARLRKHGWSHKVPLEQGLEATVEWWRERAKMKVA